MWSDELDKKIRDAADQHPPAFDDKAWDKMHAILEKELPQEKKERRWVFLLLFLVLGGGAIFFMTQEKKIRTEPQTINSRSQDVVDKATAPASPHSNLTTTKVDQPVNSVPNTSGKEPQHRIEPTHFSAEPISKQQTGASSAFASGNSSAIQTQVSAVNEKTSTGQSVVAGRGIDGVTVALPVVNDSSSSATLSAVKSDTAAQSVAANKPARKSGKKKNEFSLMFSTGPDFSSVAGKTGKMRLQAGVGVGYSIGNKWTIRTGFFVARKLYAADSADYHPPKNFWNYYTNLSKVKANCLVYEIPVSVMYRFAENRKNSWFVSAGVSSYIMKKESYDVYYKNSMGMTQNHQLEFNNENKHLFSVVDLSAGYEHKFSDRLSIMAEPYLKLPAGGVGFGKVKLNSGGVLITAVLKPFQKR